MTLQFAAVDDTSNHLSRTHSILLERSVVPAEMLRAEIAESWVRCLETGLDPTHAPQLRVVESCVLRMARQQLEPLRSLAIEEMINLRRQIAGTYFVVAFARADGLLLDTVFENNFDPETIQILPGGLWSEDYSGTNALGTAARVGRPLTVHAGEHFFAEHANLTCASAPVFGPDGTLLGILDASSDHRLRQERTRTLVNMAAIQIENRLLRSQFRGNIILTFHSRSEYLSTPSAGLIAFDGDGIVLGANSQARFLLLGLTVTVGQSFSEIFRARFSAYMSNTKAGESHNLEDQLGGIFAAVMASAKTAALGHVLARPRCGIAESSFVAEDPAVAAIIRKVELAASRQLPILINGETGTGKEQLARHAHRAAQRKGEFVALNCAALPENLVEAELFGHADGAFTGARRGGSPGLVVEAHGGTLFLDEIGDMPMSVQAKLLRLLDNWSVRPVGGGRARQVDILLVAATNASLEQLIQVGQFRADLFYRLSTVAVVLPPLRARRDFDSIVRNTLASVASQWEITPEAILRLAQQAWPGNIRELRSVLTRLTLAETSGLIKEDSLDALMSTTDAVRDKASTGAQTLREETRHRIAEVLRQANGNVSETARRLGTSRNTIYRAIDATQVSEGP